MRRLHSEPAQSVRVPSKQPKTGVCDVVGSAAVEQRRQRGAARVVARVSSRPGHAAAEDQPPVRVVQQRLAGRGRVEHRRVGAVLVRQDVHARNRRCRPPQIRLLPAGFHVQGPVEDHVGRHAILGVRHQHRELADRGARAGTLRVREHQERRTVRVAHERRRGRPEGRRMGRRAGRLRVGPQPSEPDADHDQPQEKRRSQQRASRPFGRRRLVVSIRERMPIHEQERADSGWKPGARSGRTSGFLSGHGHTSEQPGCRRRRTFSFGKRTFLPGRWTGGVRLVCACAHLPHRCRQEGSGAARDRRPAGGRDIVSL